MSAKVGAEFYSSWERTALDVAGFTAVAGAIVVPGAMVADRVVSDRNADVKTRLISMVLGAAAPTLTAMAATCIEQRKLNPFYTQERVGSDSRAIDVIKLLTYDDAHTDAESRGQKDIEVGGPDALPAKPLASLMRRVGADELPQLLNYLNGDTGFFGMRRQVQSVLDRRYKAAKRAGCAQFFDEYMGWYELGSGLIAPDIFYAHKLRRYHEDGPEALNIMKIAVGFARTASTKNTLQFICDMPRLAAMSPDEILNKYASDVDLADD